METPIEKNSEQQPQEEFTEDCIIITSNENNYSFNKKSYIDKFLAHLISKDEWDKILLDAGKVMSASWGKKKVKDQIKLPKSIVLLGLLCVVLIIIYMITLYLSTSAEDGTALLGIAIICICASSIIAMILAVYNFSRKLERFKSLEEIISEDMLVFLDKINNEYKGKLNFSLIEDSKSLKCDILIKRNKESVKIEENGGRTDTNRPLMSGRQNQPKIEILTPSKAQNSKKNSRVGSFNIQQT
jgi:hypothetical protein